jgi:L-threonylcarbamoyladenylate synthase
VLRYAKTCLWPADPQGLARAAEALEAGHPVGLPTETVYGLAARLADPLAIAQVFEAKGRPLYDPLIVHVASLEAAAEVGRLPDDPALRALLASRWPGPLTVVLERTALVPDLVTAGASTVAVRVPDHPVALEVIRRVGPLVAPSANRFGRISPTSAREVLAELEGRILGCLDGGPCPVGVESTILQAGAAGYRLLRPGGLPLEVIQEALGEVQVEARGADGGVMPGSLEAHYAPGTPLILVRDLLDGRALPPLAGRRVGVLWPLGEAAPVARVVLQAGAAAVVVEALSPAGEPREAAVHLYSALRRLDEGGHDLLLTTLPAGPGLALALRDRLRRASRGSRQASEAGHAL